VVDAAEPQEDLPRPVLPALHPEVHNRSLLDLMLNVFAGRELEVLSTMPSRRQFNNMVRLMDKAVIEYALAHARCDDWTQGLDVTGAQLSSYFRAIDHMENCINALHRTLLHLDQIKRLPAGPSIDRAARKALQAGIDKINDARDWIEHTDEKLSKLDEGVALPAVYLEADLVTVGERSLAYSDLAQWIHQTFRLVRALLDEAPRGTTA
jgi:hypothetical protein